MQHRVTGWLAGVALLAIATAAFADVPQTMSFQARIADGSGTPISDATHTFAFALYDASGTSVWTETQSLLTSHGLFTALLGTVTPLPALPWDTTYTVGFSVDGGAEMSPRYVLASSPYSLDNRWTVSRATPTHVLLRGPTTPRVWFGASDTSTIGLGIKMNYSQSPLVGESLYTYTDDANSTGLDVTTTVNGQGGGGAYGIHALVQSATSNGYGGWFEARANALGSSASAVYAFAEGATGQPGTTLYGVEANATRRDHGPAVGVATLGYSTMTDVGDTAFGLYATAYGGGVRMAAKFEGQILGTVSGTGLQTAGEFQTKSIDDIATGLALNVSGASQGVDLSSGVWAAVTDEHLGAVGGHFEAYATGPSADVYGVQGYASDAGADPLNLCVGVEANGVRLNGGPAYGLYAHAQTSGGGSDTAFGLYATSDVSPPVIGIAAKFDGKVLINGPSVDTGATLSAFSGLGYQQLTSIPTTISDGVAPPFTFGVPADNGTVEVDIDLDWIYLASDQDRFFVQLYAGITPVSTNYFLYNFGAGQTRQFHARWVVVKNDNLATSYSVKAWATVSGPPAFLEATGGDPNYTGHLTWAFHPRYR